MLFQLVAPFLVEPPGRTQCGEAVLILGDDLGHTLESPDKRRYVQLQVDEQVAVQEVRMSDAAVGDGFEQVLVFGRGVAPPLETSR